MLSICQRYFTTKFSQLTITHFMHSVTVLFPKVTTADIFSICLALMSFFRVFFFFFPNERELQENTNCYQVPGENKEQVLLLFGYFAVQLARRKSSNPTDQIQRQ